MHLGWGHGSGVNGYAGRGGGADDISLTVTGTGATIAIIAVVVVPVAGFLLALYYRANRPEVYAQIGNPLEE